MCLQQKQTLSPKSPFKPSRWSPEDRCEDPISDLPGLRDLNLLILGPTASKGQKRTRTQPALCTGEHTPRGRRRFTSRKQGSQEARTVPHGLRRPTASAPTHREGLRGIPTRLQGGRNSRPERAHTGDWGGRDYVWIWGTGPPLLPQFSAQVPRPHL